MHKKAVTSAAKDTREFNMTLNNATPEEIKAPLLADYHRNIETEKHLQDNPRQTVLLLLQGAVDKGNLAKVCHKSQAWVEKGFHLGRMTTILDALRDRLLFTQDTPLAYDLEELYRYADQCVQEAVTEKELTYLNSAIEVMTELRDAWLDMLVQEGGIEL